jgi:hypothetical protein
MAQSAWKRQEVIGVALTINRIIAMVRAKVEHPFRVLKRQFGY